MKRTAFMALLLAASACHGGKTITNHEGSGTGTAEASGSGVDGDGDGQGTPADPHLAARQAFENPGGMWMPRQIGDQAQLLGDLGLEIPADSLSDPTKAPLSAVISLRSGGRPFCTASFVSKDGLFVTNHHCAQEALELNSTADHNLVEDGFLAKTMADEVPAGPTQSIYVAQKMTDVTNVFGLSGPMDLEQGTMRKPLAEIKDANKRHDELEKRQKELVAACEKDRPNTKCVVSSFFNGAEWQMIEYLEIKDLKLVYVPARTIGDYGGEIDNWAWPRQTGDYSFFRAYVDGKPYQPAAYLKVAQQGLQAHDLVMVVGYPGRTNRQVVAAELQHNMDWFYPHYIEKANARMALLADLQKQGGDVALKAGVDRQFVQNGLEKYQGIYDGLQKSTLLQDKSSEEQAFRDWTAQDPSRKKYADAMDQIEVILKAQFADAEKEETWKDIAYRGTLLDVASFLARWTTEQQKKDADRRPGYQDRDRAAVTGQMHAFNRSYNRVVDRGFMKLHLQRAAADPNAKTWLPQLLGLKKGAKVDDKAIDKALDGWYAKATLEDEKTRVAMLDAKPAALKKSKDPFIKLALVLLPEVLAHEKRDDARMADLVLQYPTYIEGMMAWKGGMIAPDANSTLRISYGTVRGYVPSADAPMYDPFTVATQILKKDTGQDPYNAPTKLLDAIKAGNWGPYEAPELGEVPVNFLSDLDITGGNSGSPVMNARGELVGLAFDGNYEGLASDVVFSGANTRTIACDIRYVLWIADAVDQADNVVQELGFKPSL